MDAQFVDDGGDGAQDLGFSGRGDVPLVIDQDGLQQRRHKVLCHLQETTEEEWQKENVTQKKSETFLS